MTVQNCTAAAQAPACPQHIEALAKGVDCAQQAVDALLKAVLLADGTAIFTSGLANRINAGTAEGWERRLTPAGSGLEQVAAARQAIAALQSALTELGEEASCLDAE